MSKIFRNIAMSKYFPKGGDSAHTLRKGLFLCPNVTYNNMRLFAPCGYCNGSPSPSEGLRQRVKRAAVLFSACKSKNFRIMNNSNEAGSLLPIEVTNGQPTVDSREIANSLGNQHKNLLGLISKHLPVIEEDYGRVAFETLPLKTKGGIQNVRIAHLTEGQSLFLLALSKNSHQAVALKSKVIKSFLYFREHFYNNNSEQFNQLVQVTTTLADSVAKATLIQEKLVDKMQNHDERLTRLEKLTITKTKATESKPVNQALKGAYIDARDQEYDFTKINHCSVRRIIVDEVVYYSINDFCSAIGANTSAHQIAKKLNRKRPTALKIWIFGNTHPAWFTTKNGLSLIVSGSRNLKDDKSVKLELRRV